MNSDNIQDETENNLSNKNKNILSYLSDIFLEKNDENDNNKLYDDFQEDVEESYENLLNLSKMDISKIYEHFEINYDNIDNHRQNSLNKKYSNTLDNAYNYEIDYELNINDNETITFLKSKK